jgi:DNA helicase-2/ATP-dependent DNA helicase PcrA
MKPLREMVDPITDEDISWVCNLMGLCELDDARREFLKSRDTLDVSACPGSGKTTLVVAKLAILARHWKSATQGICVLSHTNVAREEIERRLGGTDVGQRLLRYPHFIDTIHGFVSKFLAKPWLASAGYSLTAIDNEQTFRARRNSMRRQDLRTLTGYLERKHVSFESLRIASIDFEFPRVGGGFPGGAHTDMYRLASGAIGAAAKKGYFCYDEIFVLGEALLEQCPSVPSLLQHRFPCVLVDEMQDTSELQSELLNTIFPRDNQLVCVWRVGDPNQAIFELDTQNSAGGFPDGIRSLGIANSFRFDASIAALASPFSLTAIAPAGLQGVRVSAEGEPLIPHTVLLFPDDGASAVLDAYGRIVLQHLTPSQRASATVSAVGAVHKPHDLATMNAAHFPKTVSHYWADYEPYAHRVGLRPSDLLGYFEAGKRSALIGSTVQRGVELVASGVLHLANLLTPLAPLRSRGRVHAQLEEILTTDVTALTTYRDLIRRILFSSHPLCNAEWQEIVGDVRLIAAYVVDGDPQSPSVDDFVQWRAAISVEQEAPDVFPEVPPNHFRCVQGDAYVDIKLSSIHMAKGETHAATLVLETFNRTHFLSSLLPWLYGKNQNGARCANDAQKRRLMEMYVAMTRPTHLLCLALKQSSLGVGDAFIANRQKLIDRGWHVQELQ